ncbi:MAG: NUDIX domain-containing protein [Phycisphaerales bacterium]|nr:NUDIX domain-containing protein [Phycisphaerales bacterium]
MTTDITDNSLPYRIAVLVYLRDAEGRLLMLHRAKAPNNGMYSPPGGKLEPATGESPHCCAIRETEEETGVSLQPNEIRLMGMVSETAYEGECHWLLFLFEVTRPIEHAEVAAYEMDEGTLEWLDRDAINSLPQPQTDREIIWPLVAEHVGGYFACHIDCRVEPFAVSLQESWKAPQMTSHDRTD